MSISPERTQDTLPQKESIISLSPWWREQKVVHGLTYLVQFQNKTPCTHNIILLPCSHAGCRDHQGTLLSRNLNLVNEELSLCPKPHQNIVMQTLETSRWKAMETESYLTPLSQSPHHVEYTACKAQNQRLCQRQPLFPTLVLFLFHIFLFNVTQGGDYLEKDVNCA